MADSNPSPPTDMDKIVLNYLQKKGYRQTEAVLRSEAHVQSLDELAAEFSQPEDASIPNYVLSYKDAEHGNPDAYNNSYLKLRGWIESSLDLYKPKLRAVLFPIFVHAYLDLVSKGMKEQASYFMETYKSDHLVEHTPLIQRLTSIVDPQHIEENDLAQTYRQNKYNLRMSQVPFELLINYLQDSKSMHILRIVNQYLNIQVVSGKAQKLTGSEADDVIGITGYPTHQIEAFNQQKVYLGQATRDNEEQYRSEVEQALKDEDAKAQAAIQEREGGKADVPMGEPLSDSWKKTRLEATIDTPGPNDPPLPPFRGNDIQAELDALRDSRKRLALGAVSLPSVCTFTFHNTHDGINCIAISEDASLIASGFSESFIKIWSLTGDKLRALKKNINPAMVNDMTDLARQKEMTGSDMKRLIGHGGPVFGLSFSHDNKYLISCSEDKTARLWSTATFTNLVVYKGHNYPVWDVDFGPYGFYFATASHDRTARLWSCDQIFPLRIFAGHLSDVDCVRFHPNSKYIVTGSSDRTARLWDVQRGSCVRVFTGHTGAIGVVTVSPDGRLMASAGEDKSIILWDLGSGRKLKRMTGHTGVIYSLSFSAEGSVLVSGGEDCTVRVWDVKKDVGNGPAATAVGTNSSNNNEKSHKKKDSAAGSGAAANGVDSKGKDAEESSEKSKKRKAEPGVSEDSLAVFPTKRTPIYKVQFTKRNLCLAAGAFLGISS